MNTYILVQWPESQEYMDKEWYDEEAIPTENSACFIPESRLINNEYILAKVEEFAKELTATKEEEDYILKEWEEGLPFEGGMNTFETILNLKMNLTVK